MKRWIIITLAGALLAAATVYQLRRNKEAAADRVFQLDTERPVGVTTTVVGLVDTLPGVVHTGVFTANRVSKLSADYQGKINEVMCDVGSMVQKGQSLIQLDNELLLLQLKNAEIQIEGLEADVERYRVLAVADAIQGIQLEKTELALRTAKVQEQIVAEQIRKTTIKAPFSGVVTARYADAGAFAGPGTPLLQLTDLSVLRFVVNVAEDQLDHFKPGAPYRVSVDAFPEVLLQGEVRMIGSVADQGKRFPVEILVRNTPDLKLRDGMYGKVTSVPTGNTKGLLISSSSIVGTSLDPMVYVVRSGKAKLQPVRIAARSDDGLLISEGLSEGDTIVSGGFINLFDGASIIVK